MAEVTVVIQAVDSRDDVSVLTQLGPDVETRFAGTVGELRQALPGADVLFGFDFKGTLLPAAWETASDLRWIQWAGAGVDALLFPELVASSVTVTNAGGIYDDAIAEHVLALVLAHAKGLPLAVRDQTSSTWRYRLSRQVAGTRATVIGAGGIGRATALILRMVGVDVTLLATTTRSDDEFGEVRAWAERDLSRTDWLVVATPLTAATNQIVDAGVLRELPATAFVVNVGRGANVDEAALIERIEDGGLAGAALDVFEVEPLPASSPLWGLDSVIITPHHAGDVDDFYGRLCQLFVENLARYRTGQPLVNLVDKRLGYRSGS